MSVSFSVGVGSALWGAITDAATERYLLIAMCLMWGAWMSLGVIVSLHEGEKFSMPKIMAGGLHLAASLVIWAMGVTVDLVAVEGQPIASLAFSGFMATAFFLKAVSKGTYFHKGLREVALKVLPGLAQGVGDITATRARRKASELNPPPQADGQGGAQ